MNALRNRTETDPGRDWKARAKGEVYEKVLVCPLMRRCAEGGPHPGALFGGFWHFVCEFPGILHETYANVPSWAGNYAVRRFLRRSAPILSGALEGMERDERVHRALWIRSSARVGIAPDQLQRWRVLPEVRKLTAAIRGEGNLARRLLYFVAVEMVAEGISRYLCQAPRFVEALGEEGMEWFTVHLVDPDDATAHEAIACQLALSVREAAHEPSDGKSVNADIQRCVDWFFAAGVACAREFAPGERRAG